jgi:hypothetical protein
MISILAFTRSPHCDFSIAFDAGLAYSSSSARESFSAERKRMAIRVLRKDGSIEYYKGNVVTEDNGILMLARKDGIVTAKLLTATVREWGILDKNDEDLSLRIRE